MANTLLDDLKQRQELTETYASYSQSRGGLGKVLGGIAGIIVILAGTLLGGGLLTALLTISATILWLAGKELIRTRIYRPLGDAQAVWPADKRREHLWRTGFVGVIAAGIAVFTIFNADFTSPPSWVYLVFIIIMPLITWRSLRTPLEFIVGVFLLAACAVHGAGGAYSLIPSAHLPLGQAISLSAPARSSLIGAIVIIPLGWDEHRRFHTLMTQMRAER